MLEESGAAGGRWGGGRAGATPTETVQDNGLMKVLRLD